MSEEDQIDAFVTELDSLIDHFRAEFDLTYSTMIGILEIKKYELCAEGAALATED